METFKIFVTIMGVLMSFGYYPQAYKIWKEKTSVGVSIPAYIIFSAGTATWLIYGIVIKDAIIILSFVFGVVGSWLVLVLTSIYKDR